jgi:hypothetical protein
MPMNDPAKDDEQEQFEQQLRGFHPVSPRALAISNRRGSRGILAVAAVALLMIATSVIVRHSPHSKDRGSAFRVAQNVEPGNPAAAPPITLGRLNAALRTSDQALNQMLDEASPQVLRRGHNGTAFFELSKE